MNQHLPPTSGRRCLLAAAALGLGLWARPGAAAVPAAEPADLIIRGGNVATMNDAAPRAEAIAVRGTRIAAVGAQATIDALQGPATRIIQLQGQLVTPGWIEGHSHFLSLGRSQMILDLSPARRWSDLVRQAQQAAQAAPAGQWIVGRGWHQEKWEQPPEPNVDGYPTHDALSQATPDHPVVLFHASGHLCIANTAAMRLAGIGAQSDGGPGGEILRDGLGQPIGVFRENAMGPIRQALARSESQRSESQQREDLLRAIQLAGRQCLRYGVTTLHDAGASFAEIDTFRQLALRGELPVRLWVMANAGNDELAAKLADYRMIGVGDQHLTVRAIKRLLDGALGSHGAWLLQPYDDLPQSSGLNTLSLQSLRRTAQLALQHDMQLCVHAIGDRANREALDLFEEAFRGQPSPHDRRWRIEHAQHLDPADIPRFAQLGVIAAMQGVHCTSDAPFVVKRLGAQRARQGAYAWRSLLDAGAVVINGADAPVESLDPLACFYASVTRRQDNQEPFFPEQCMTRAEALRSYTRDAAYAGFEQDLKGVLAPGMLADIVVISHDLLAAPQDQLKQAEVLYTIVGGKILYQHDAGR